MQQVDVMPYSTWQSVNNALFPQGRRYYWKGTLTETLTDSMFDAMVEYGSNPELPWVNATIELYAGAMNQVASTATAFHQRDALYQIISIGAWEGVHDDEAGKAWARDLNNAVAPLGLSGELLNFNSSPDNQETRGKRVQASYGENWDRLRAIKRHYDPDNFFHCNNNIPPSS